MLLCGVNNRPGTFSGAGLVPLPPPSTAEVNTPTSLAKPETTCSSFSQGHLAPLFPAVVPPCETPLYMQWFGHYSWGHDAGKWQYNDVHDNEIYGFDPHDDSDNVKIIGNTVWNNGVHGISESNHNEHHGLGHTIGRRGLFPRYGGVRWAILIFNGNVAFGPLGRVSPHLAQTWT